MAAQAQDGLHPKLADSGEMHSHDLRDLPQTQLFVIVQAKHNALVFWHPVDRERQDTLQLRTLDGL